MSLPKSMLHVSGGVGVGVGGHRGVIKEAGGGAGGMTDEANCLTRKVHLVATSTMILGS